MRSIIAGSIDATKSNIVVLSPQTRCGVLETAMPLQVDLGITRTAENRIDMALEMLDVNALDSALPRRGRTES